MSRKRKNRKSSARKSAAGDGAAKLAARKARRSGRRLRRVLVSLAVVAGVLGVAGYGLSLYREDYADERQLSDIGNGIPTVVQVHDPDCPLCRELMTNTRQALKGVEGEVQYRIADLSTGAGRAFSRKHGNLPNVTLVFFNGEGRNLRQLGGVNPADMIQASIQRLVDHGR